MSNDEYGRDDPGPDWRERAASAERGERERELRREHGDDVVRDVRDRDDVRSEQMEIHDRDGAEQDEYEKNCE